MGPGHEEPPGGGQPRDGEAADEELIGRLRRLAAAADPVPAALISTARAAFVLRDVDAQVAELVRDSAVDAPVTAMRGGDARMLSFEAGDTVIECEVTAHAGARDVKGQLSGGAATLVEAQVAGTRPVNVHIRPLGFFAVRGLPSGPFRLRCRMADGATIVTSWTSV